MIEGLLAWRRSLPSSVRQLLIGFSGGCDSHVLLHGLHQCEQLDPRFLLRAIHIHHGLNLKADEWVIHCQAVADKLSIPLTVVKLGLVPPEGESVENVARQARYAAFSEALQPNEILLTAHHLEDQAETVLLQLLRGAGVKGLSGMPYLKPFAKGGHARPLLGVSRKVIDAYAEQQELCWIEDSANKDLRFTRNFLRHRVMPLLAEINPNYAGCLARSAEHCQSTQALLEEGLEKDLAACITADQELLVAELKKYPLLHQEALVRFWLHTMGYPLPSSKKLRTIVQQMIEARIDRHPCVEWGGWQISRCKGIIRVSERVKYSIV